MPKKNLEKRNIFIEHFSWYLHSVLSNISTVNFPTKFWGMQNLIECCQFRRKMFHTQFSNNFLMNHFWLALLYFYVQWVGSNMCAVFCILCDWVEKKRAKESIDADTWQFNFRHIFRYNVPICHQKCSLLAFIRDIQTAQSFGFITKNFAFRNVLTSNGAQNAVVRKKKKSLMHKLLQQPFVYSTFWCTCLHTKYNLTHGYFGLNERSLCMRHGGHASSYLFRIILMWAIIQIYGTKFISRSSFFNGEKYFFSLVIYSREESLNALYKIWIMRTLRSKL